ncbi:MAG: LEA type 2 family protein [Thermoplasmata archaeon]|nr:LEA type 2 family protein [Thermoplasmata archaeon]
MKEKWKTILKRAKLIISLVILAGVIIHLVLVYNAAKSLEMENERIVGLSPTYKKIDEYELKFSLTLKNPKSTSIEVDYIKYDVYVEDEFVGSGEKARLLIPPGLSNHTFSFTFSAINLTSSTKNLLLQGEVDVTVKGDVIIPAKFLGLFTWRYIKLPYTIHDTISVSL